MDAVLPSLPLLVAFVGASVILAVTPGPGVLYIVARSLSQGRTAGLVSAAGVAVGNLGNALAAALGLGAVLAWSATAFTIVKLAGASPFAQSCLLAVLFVIIAATSDAIYALAAGSARRAFGQHAGMHSAGRVVSGATYIGLGLFTALSGRPAP